MAPTMTITEKRERRDALIKRASERFEAAGGKALSDDDWSAYQQERKELDDLGTEIAAADLREREERAARDQIRQLSAAMGTEQQRVEDTLAGAPHGRTLGEMFAGSDQYRRFLSRFPGGIPESAKGISSDPVRLPFNAVQLKAMLASRPMIGATLLTGTSATSAGAFVVNDMRQDLYVPVAQRQLKIIDLIDVLSTESDAVDFPRQTARTNSAAPTAEATTTSDGTKPESSMAFEKVTVAVETIAHWIPATKRALSDVGQLRGIIDGDLRYGLNEELEDQVMNGDGASPNLRGIFNTSSVQTQAYSTDLFTTTRKAVTLMQTVAKESPNGWIFSPTDWETFELLKDAENRYYFGGPFSTGPKTLWGYPPTVSEAMLAGHAFLANFMRCKLWMREGITISASDSHANFFIQNLIAVLAELRAAFGVTKPSAIVKLSLNAAS